MPLMKGKSEKAFGHNVGAEMNAGKPRAQALAIAYATKRKKMAKGGEVENEKLHPHHEPGIHPIVQGIMSKKYAMGGMVDHDEPESMAVSPEWHDEDSLSDEEQDYALDLTYPDPDHKEDTEGMSEPTEEDQEKRKRGILIRAMQSLNK